MGKGYYFTLSVEIPEDMPVQTSKEFYSSKKYIQNLEYEYNCEVEFIRIEKGRAEYKVYLNEKREEKVVADGKG